jgi:type IV pilus assembly protein PilC
MARFHYQALNDNRQLVSGELEAESVAQALAQLEAQGLSVQSIGFASGAGRVSPASPRAARPVEFIGETPFATSVEQAVLQSQLASVLARGKFMVPPLRAFAEEMPSGRRQRQLQSVAQTLERGDAGEATAALSALPEYWIPLLSAATVSQDPGRVLHEFLNETQRADALRMQWRRSLAYPLLILGLAALVIVALSFLVVPVFRDIFREFELRLPPITVVIIRIAEWITSGRVLLAAGGVAIAGFLLVGASRLLPARIQAWFGDRFGTPLGRTTALARFTQFAADLLEAGLPTPSALRVAGYATNSMRLRRAAWRLAREIDRGSGIAVPLARDPLSQTVRHALEAEMPPEARVKLLREVSRCHARRGALRLSWTRGLIEPIGICVVGVIVGGTVLALFMPLFSLIQGLSA